jgi:hypothetical protein
MSNLCRRIFHRCFLPSFSSYGWGVSEEKIKTWKVNERQTTDAKWWQKLTLPLARWANKPEALKSLYRSPGNKKKQLVLCKNYVLRHLGITINIKNTKFVKDLPIIDAQFRFNQCNSFREEYISVFSPYGSVLILWPVVAAILDFRSA